MVRWSTGMKGQIFSNNTSNNFHCRRDGKPVGEISLSHGHAEPVFKTIWTSSKTGSEFFTASSDGTVLWWDIRRFTKPVDRMILDPHQEDSVHDSLERADGASVLEYEWTIPSKFMVGTQQGKNGICNQ